MMTETAKHLQDGVAPLRLSPGLYMMPRDTTLAEAVVMGRLLEAAEHAPAERHDRSKQRTTCLGEIWLDRN